MSDEAAWTPGSVIDGHRLVRVLGRGGMGEVWLVEHVATGAARALKVLRGAFAPEDVMRFRREVEALARVDGHPNLVRVHAAGVHARCPWVVMERVSGGDLQARLEAGPLEPSLAAALVRDLARGVAHAHAHGVMHRDLKPANVLLDERGAPVLVDFGLARLRGAESLTQTGTILGTPVYMAPEQGTGGVVDERADVYGLGAIFYQTLCGRPPFSGSSPLEVLAKVCEGRLAPPRTVHAQVPRELEAICLRALALDPGARWVSAAALGAALDGWLARSGRAVRPRGSVVVGLGSLVVVLSLALAIGALRSGPDAPTSRDPLAVVTSAVEAVPVTAAPAAPRGEWAQRFDRGDHERETTRPAMMDYGSFQAELEAVREQLEQPTLRRDAVDALRRLAAGGEPSAQRILARVLLPTHPDAARTWWWKASRPPDPDVRAGVHLAVSLILASEERRDLEGAALLLAEAEARCRAALDRIDGPTLVELACGLVQLRDPERAVALLDDAPDKLRIQGGLAVHLEGREPSALRPCASFLEGVASLRGWSCPLDPGAAAQRFTELRGSPDASVAAAAALWLEQLSTRRLTWAQRFEREASREQVRDLSSVEDQVRVFNRDLRAELGTPALRTQALRTLEEGVATGHPVCQKLLGEELLRDPQQRARGLHLLWRASRDPTPDQHAGIRLAFELMHGPEEARDLVCARLLLEEAEARARASFKAYEPAFVAEVACGLVHLGLADRAARLLEDAPRRLDVLRHVETRARNGEEDPLRSAARFLCGVGTLRGWLGAPDSGAARVIFETLLGSPDQGAAGAARAWLEQHW